MENTARVVAKKLLEIDAIKLNVEAPFNWASGWKSPIYCDNRLALSYPEVRAYIKGLLAQTIKGHFGAVEAIAGVATAGIPQGALVADALNVPFVYVRSKPKGHGMENMIEGKVVPGQKVVVIEDLISTGGSSLKAVEALRASGIAVLGMVSIFTYGFDLAKESFDKEGLEVLSLSSYGDLIDEALQLERISQGQIGDLKKWREDPANWGR